MRRAGQCRSWLLRRWFCSSAGERLGGGGQLAAVRSAVTTCAGTSVGSVRSAGPQHRTLPPFSQLHAMTLAAAQTRVSYWSDPKIREFMKRVDLGEFFSERNPFVNRHAPPRRHAARRIASSLPCSAGYTDGQRACASVPVFPTHRREPCGGLSHNRRVSNSEKRRSRSCRHIALSHLCLGFSPHRP
jgi:hypothetical protein